MRAGAYVMFTIAIAILIAMMLSAAFAVVTDSAFDFSAPAVFFGALNLAAVLAVGGLVLLGGRGR